MRLRTRAHIILLAAQQRLTAPAIVVIVREDDQTVRNWLKRYRAEGIDGLNDRPMPGAWCTAQSYASLYRAVGRNGAATATESGPTLLAVDAPAAGGLFG